MNSTRSIPGVTRRRTVFVSSKFKGLEEARRIVIDAILRANHIPVAMEYFRDEFGGARLQDQIRLKVDESEIFVVLVGAELSNPAAGSEWGYVEQEVEEAKRMNIPIIPILLDETEHRAATRARRGTRPSAKHKEYRRRLEALRAAVTEGGALGVIYFSMRSKTFDDLGARFTASLIRTAACLGESRGWVDGRLFDRFADNPIIEGEAARNQFFQRFTERMTEFRVLSGRVQRWEEHKRATAEFFWSTYFPAIVRRGIRTIFLESGSAIAYVTKAFIDRVQLADSEVDHRFSRRLTLLSNNFISLLDLLLTPKARWRWGNVGVFPAAAFSDTYGATYGSTLGSVQMVNSPTEDMMHPHLRLLDGNAENMLEKSRAEFARQLGNDALILMTASGIDIRRQMRPDERYRSPSRVDPTGMSQEAILLTKNGPPGERPPATPFPGPHTGDFLNMMIKRSLLKQACPRVLFLDEYKWDLDFIPGNCFPVCDQRLRWREIVQRTPLAIVTAARPGVASDRMAKELVRIGLRIVARSSPPQGTSGEPTVLVAANAEFERALPRFDASVLPQRELPRAAGQRVRRLRTRVPGQR